MTPQSDFKCRQRLSASDMDRAVTEVPDRTASDPTVTRVTVTGMTAGGRQGLRTSAGGRAQAGLGPGEA